MSNEKPQIEVQPVPGKRLPLAHNPRRYVDKKMKVSDTAYYRRAIASGSLLIAEKKASAKSKRQPAED